MSSSLKPTLNPNFKENLKATKDSFDGFFFPFLNQQFSILQANGFYDSLLYSLQAGGKRIRPIFVLLSSKDTGNSAFLKNAYLLAASIECIHTYSLIHDDLPSMDNDDFRRGLPTNHKKFGESTAILAGDALNSFAFFCLSLLDSSDPTLVSDCLRYLHDGAGFKGMVLGQYEDLSLPNQTSDWTPERLNLIHSLKTGALISSSFLLGNRLRPNFQENEEVLKQYSKEIGLLFQITDDILDVEGTKESLGKTPGKDSSGKKFTYPSLFGMDQSRILRDESKNKAIALSQKISSPEKSFFEELPKYIAERQN